MADSGIQFLFEGIMSHVPVNTFFRKIIMSIQDFELTKPYLKTPPSSIVTAVVLHTNILITVNISKKNLKYN